MGFRVELPAGQGQTLNHNQAQSRNHSHNEIRQIWEKLSARSDIGFIQVPEQTQTLHRVQELAQKFSQKKNIVHIGIGGSSLGPEMLVRSLQQNFSQRHFYFWNNIDPDELHTQILDLERDSTQVEDCLFYVVSKTGSTAETLAHLSLALNWLEQKGINQERWRDFIVICTDPVKSELKNFADQFQLERLEFPANVGGRFSVLTVVGLFPAALADLSCEDLLAGALAQKKIIDRENSPAVFDLALCLHRELTGGQRTQTVLMPYSSKLKTLGAWFVQLWAESLGKKLNLQGKKVNAGLTPICAVGATDQHSIVQLFCEGPADKFFILLEIEKFNHDFKLASPSPLSSGKMLSPYSMGQLIKAEFEGTKQALLESQSPVATLSLEQLTEYHLGCVLYFLETLTALMGGLMGIDPFNQPGVEAGKKYAWEYLQKK